MDVLYKKLHDASIKKAAADAGLKYYNLSWWQFDAQHWPVHPRVAEETERSEGRPLFKMIHGKWLMLCIILKGKYSYSFDAGEPFTMTPGDICIIPPSCHYSCNSDQGYHKLVLMLDGVLLRESCDVLGINEPTNLSGPKYAPIHDAIIKIMKMLKEESNDISHILSVTHFLLSELSQALVSQNHSTDYHLFCELKTRLGNKLDQKISLDDITSQLNISKSLAHKLFKKYSNMTPVQYRISKKMESASFSLLYTEHSLKEISYQLGYSNQNYFSNDFKKHYGSSPTDYRTHQKK